MVHQWHVSGAEPDRVVDDYFRFLARDEPTDPDPFAVELFQNVVGRVGELDEIIRRNANHWSLDRMSLVVRHLLQLAIAELMAGQTPSTVVIDEALEVGKRFAGGESTRFVNGVLEAAKVEIGAEQSAENQLLALP